MGDEPANGLNILGDFFKKFLDGAEAMGGDVAEERAAAGNIVDYLKDVISPVVIAAGSIRQNLESREIGTEVTVSLRREGQQPEELGTANNLWEVYGHLHDHNVEIGAGHDIKLLDSEGTSVSIEHDGRPTTDIDAVMSDTIKDAIASDRELAAPAPPAQFDDLDIETMEPPPVSVEQEPETQFEDLGLDEGRVPEPARAENAPEQGAQILTAQQLDGFEAVYREAATSPHRAELIPVLDKMYPDTIVQMLERKPELVNDRQLFPEPVDPRKVQLYNMLGPDTQAMAREQNPVYAAKMEAATALGIAESGEDIGQILQPAVPGARP